MSTPNQQNPTQVNYNRPTFGSRGNVPVTSDLLLAMLAFFIPPFSVFVKRGFNLDLLINIILTMLGAFPGILHAWYLILKYPDDGIPYLTQWVDQQNIITPVTGASGYQPLSEDSVGALETGVIPGSYVTPQQQQQPQYQPPASSAPNRASSPYVVVSSSSSKNSAGPSQEDSNPPPYQGAPSGFTPGDNKIQYGAQF